MPGANPRPLHLLLMGPPGSGKGTQARLLAARCGFARISTGEIFRAANHADPARYPGLREHLAKGGLATDDQVVDLVSGTLETMTGADIVIDGFPRTLRQSAALDDMLAARGLAIDLVVFLDAPDKELARRMAFRLQCDSCGEIFSTDTPRIGECTNCGAGPVLRRDDDADESVRMLRVTRFRSSMAVVLSHYEGRGLLRRIDASKTLDEVADEIADAISRARKYNNYTANEQ